MIVIIARTQFKTVADRDIMMAAIAVSAVKTVMEPGVICYQSSVDPIDPLVLNAVEVYETEQAMFDHTSSDHMAVLMESIAGVEAEIVINGFEGDLTPLDMATLLERQGLTSSGKLNFAGSA